MKKRTTCLGNVFGISDPIATSAANVDQVLSNPLSAGSSLTYLTTDELSSKIKYDPRTIRESLKDSVLLEGVHYIRPFGGRKILYIWEKIETDMVRMTSHRFEIPMANGGVCHG
jgi:hypothetical protein